MNMRYRPLGREDTDSVIALWTEVMEKPREQVEAEFYDYGNEPDPYNHTVVAQDDNGELLAAAQFWLRELRNSQGMPCKVGHVIHIATRQQMRRQGHATRLLTLLIEMMRAENCQWSILFAAEEARSVYETLGWRGFANTVWQGTVSPTWQSIYAASFQLQTAERGLTLIPPVYTIYNQERPLTVVRDDAYWNGYAKWMFSQWIDEFDGKLFTVGDPQVTGYALAFFSPMGFLIAELGYTDPAALSALLTAVVDHTTKLGFPQQGRLHAPAESTLQTALVALFGATLHTVTDLSEKGYTPMMAQSLDPALSIEALSGFFNAAGSISWMIDQF
jgi:predicted acetyltransferase